VRSEGRFSIRTLCFAMMAGNICYSGRVLPANPFALATLPPPSTGSFVTGVFGAQVVAVDANTGSVIAATLSGWTCNPSNSLQFDGSYQIDRLPIGHSYLVYAEPLAGPASSADFGSALIDLCSSSAPDCTTPAVDTNFNPQFRTSAN
jgi:hypothetical protein